MAKITKNTFTDGHTAYPDDGSGSWQVNKNVSGDGYTAYPKDGSGDPVRITKNADGTYDARNANGQATYETSKGFFGGTNAYQKTSSGSFASDVAGVGGDIGDTGGGLIVLLLAGAFIIGMPFVVGPGAIIPLLVALVVCPFLTRTFDRYHLARAWLGLVHYISIIILVNFSFPVFLEIKGGDGAMLMCALVIWLLVCWMVLIFTLSAPDEDVSGFFMMLLIVPAAGIYALDGITLHTSAAWPTGLAIISGVLQFCVAVICQVLLSRKYKEEPKIGDAIGSSLSSFSAKAKEKTTAASASYKQRQATKVQAKAASAKATKTTTRTTAKSRSASGTGKKESSGIIRTAVIIAVVAGAVALCAALFLTLTKETPYPVYGALELLSDQDPSNDGYFGPSVSTESKSIVLYEQALKDAARQDPVLGAAVLGWADNVWGTAFLAKANVPADADLPGKVNIAAAAFAANRDLYNNVLDEFFAFAGTGQPSYTIFDLPGGYHLSEAFQVRIVDGQPIPQVIGEPRETDSSIAFCYIVNVDGQDRRLCLDIEHGFGPLDLGR